MVGFPTTTVRDDTNEKGIRRLVVDYTISSPYATRGWSLPLAWLGFAGIFYGHGVNVLAAEVGAVPALAALAFEYREAGGGTLFALNLASGAELDDEEEGADGLVVRLVIEGYA